MTYKAIGECSRWELACDTLQILAELASDYDDDGVDVFFLNSKHALKVIYTLNPFLNFKRAMKASVPKRRDANHLFLH